MPTQNLTIRLADDLREPAEERAALEHRSVAYVIRSALRAYLDDDGGSEQLRQALRRAQAAEAALERAKGRASAGRLAAQGAGAVAASKRVRVSLRDTRADRLAAALDRATRKDPATVPGCAALSGFGRDWVRKLLPALTLAGYLEKTGAGQWVPVPGRDIREGITQTRALAQLPAAQIASSLQERAGGPPPATAPAVPAAEATQPAEGKSAATAERPRQRRTAAKARAGSEAAPLAAANGQHSATAQSAETVAPGTVLFQQPGADRVVTSEVPEAKTCPPHPKRRVVKGYCGACGRQVPDDEKLK